MKLQISRALTTLLVAQFLIGVHLPQDVLAKEVSSTQPGVLNNTEAAKSNFKVEALKKRVDKAIDDAIAEKRVVGTVVVICKDGKVVYRRAAGYADRENAVKAQPNTVFRLASMSKTIVAATALALIQEGKLGLDDPVTKWLPAFTPKLADGSQPTITVRQLLTHTSGLNYLFSEQEDGPYHKAHVSDGMDQPGLSMSENLKRIASCPLLFAPGSKWNYSLSIDVLGAVIEKASGKTLGEAVRDAVTMRLKMKDTAFVIASTKRVAVPYMDSKPEPVRMTDPQEMKSKASDMWFSPSRIFDKTSYPSGGAGLAGTADDYIKFLEAIRTENPSLLDKHWIAEMKNNQVGDLKTKQSPGWGFSLGSGVLIETVDKYPYSKGTLEWGGAYGDHWFMDPEMGLSVVELSNTTLEGIFGKYSHDLINAVYGTSEPQ
jgi:CubicO group peptidase (beta-lactamase class C family)